MSKKLSPEDLPIRRPAEHEEPVQLTPSVQPGRPKPAKPFTVDAYELAWVRRLYTGKQLHAHSNGRGRFYLRLSEMLPWGARQLGYERVVEALYSYAEELRGGPRATDKGKIVHHLDRASQSSLPSNRDVRPAEEGHERSWVNALTSVKARMDGLLRGVPPEAAMREARAAYVRRKQSSDCRASLRRRARAGKAKPSEPSQ